MFLSSLYSAGPSVRRVRETRDPLVRQIKAEFLSVHPTKIKIIPSEGISGVGRYSLNLGRDSIAEVERVWRGTGGPSDYYIALFSSHREVLRVETGEKLYVQIEQRLAAYHATKEKEYLKQLSKRLKKR